MSKKLLFLVVSALDFQGPSHFKTPFVGELRGRSFIASREGMGLSSSRCHRSSQKTLTLPLAQRGDAIDALFLRALDDGDNRESLSAVHEHTALSDGDVARQQLKRDEARRRHLRGSRHGSFSARGVGGAKRWECEARKQSRAGCR